MQENFLSLWCFTRLLSIFEIYSGGILLLLLFYLCFAESLGNRATHRMQFRKIYGLLLS